MAGTFDNFDTLPKLPEELKDASSSLVIRRVPKYRLFTLFTLDSTMKCISR